MKSPAVSPRNPPWKTRSNKPLDSSPIHHIKKPPESGMQTGYRAVFPILPGQERQRRTLPRHRPRRTAPGAVRCARTATDNRTALPHRWPGGNRYFGVFCRMGGVGIASPLEDSQLLLGEQRFQHFIGLGLCPGTDHADCHAVQLPGGNGGHCQLLPGPAAHRLRPREKPG